MFPIYIVRPKRTAHGFELCGPSVPFPLWYRDELQAGSMAHHLGRGTGGCVVYLTRDGFPIVAETIEREFQATGTTPRDHNARLLAIAKAEFGAERVDPT